jgi:DNA-binding PadR family transcriptional regulator
MFEQFGRWRQERGFVPEDFGRGREGYAEGEERSHRGRGRGFGRPFDHGDLRLVILSLIAEKPRHGYEIIKAIEDQFGGSYTPSPGVVYPTLTMLEELGHTTVEESGGKKLYTITAEGRADLVAKQSSADAAMGRMRQRLHGHGPDPQLMRAMENLKLALRLRHRGGPLSAEQLHSIVAALDAAAVAIERS